MNTLPATADEILPTNPIRVETALSRYPVHRLAKHGDIKIDIRVPNEYGEISIKWEVNHIPKFGQPGPLAYKLDTLVINRRIEEAPRPIPRIIRIGSHKEVCEQLGTDEGGRTLKQQKQAFHQNASSYVTAKIKYRTKDGGERYAEIGDTRYGVVFTGELLPDGRKADAIYIVLHDFYIEIINNTITRPLDYDFLRTLPPAPQRFYELLSYQMYAAIKNARPRAKLLYSEFCTYAPQTRYFDWEHARKQMAKIDRPHRQAGYVGKVNYQDTVDSDGQPDWIMLYQPGPKARAEYRAFTKRGGLIRLETEPFELESTARPPAPLLLIEQEPSPLIAALTERGVKPKAAADLVERHPAAFIEGKIEQFDWEMTQPKPPKRPAGYLVKSIVDGYDADPDFISNAERERREETKRQAEQEAAEARRQKQAEETLQQDRRREEDAYWSNLTPTGQSDLEAKALAAASEEVRSTYLSMKRQRMGEGLLSGIRREYIRTLIDAQAVTEPA